MSAPVKWRRRFVASVPILLCSLSLANSLKAESDRARDLGIPFAGEPGPLNTITDVQGV